MAVPGTRALRAPSVFASSLRSRTCYAGSGEMEEEDEAAVVNHSAMTVLSHYICLHTKTFSLLPYFLSLHLLLRSSLSLRWQPWQRRWTPSWRRFLSEGITPPSPPSPRSLSTGFLCPLKTDVALCPFFFLALFLPLLSLPPPHLYIYCILMNVVPDISPGSILTNSTSEYYCWSGVCVVWAMEEYLWLWDQHCYCEHLCRYET